VRGSLRGYRTLVAGVVGIVAITVLAIHGEGSTDGAIAQIAGIIGVLAGRSMAERDSHPPAPPPASGGPPA
jgi:type IV secretory pathway VirB2 component (pilin)